jgi:GNAT superfamily N-acetyltransferase
VPGYRIRAAAAEDVEFLADVVVTATRAQGRLSRDFDEAEWRARFAEWTTEQIRGQVPGSATSVIEIGDERVGRLRVAYTADNIELCGIQLLPRAQRHGVGTAIIEDLKAQAAAASLPLDLGVEKDNPEAGRLYERLGFVQVSETEQELRLRWSPRPHAEAERAS